MSFPPPPVLSSYFIAIEKDIFERQPSGTQLPIKAPPKSGDLVPKSVAKSTDTRFEAALDQILPSDADSDGEIDRMTFEKYMIDDDKRSNSSTPRGIINFLGLISLPNKP